MLSICGDLSKNGPHTFELLVPTEWHYLKGVGVVLVGGSMLLGCALRSQKPKPRPESVCLCLWIRMSLSATAPTPACMLPGSPP